MYYIDIVLSDDQRSALVDKDVSFSELTLGIEAYHRQGIAFSEEDCEAVLGILGLIRDEDRSDERLRTPQGKRIEDYFELSLAQLPSPMEPIVWSNDYEQSEYDVEVFSSFQAESGLGLAIKYFEDVGFAEHRHHPGVLFVNAYSSPGEDYRLDHRSFKRGDGSVIRTRKPGKGYIRIAHSDRRALAYFRGDSKGGSLWLLFNTDYNDRALLEYVLHAVMRLMRPELGAICSYKEYENIAARERYIRSAEHRLQEESQQADSRANDSNDQIESARRTLVLALQEGDAARHRRDELQNGDTGEMLRKMRERLAKEFDELISSPDFESLEFEEDQVIAVTRPLKLRHEGRVYEMGKYKITISDDGRITIASVKGHGHPHVDGERPCLGNASESVAKLQAEKSFGLLLPFLVSYLENGYNPADSYRRIGEFKVKNYDESKEVKKGSSKPRRKRAKNKKEVKNGPGKPRRKRAKRSSGRSG